MAGILGVVILALYGDRRSYYQDPVTYHQGYTKLTPLGQVHSFLRILKMRTSIEMQLTFLDARGSAWVLP